MKNYLLSIWLLCTLPLFSQDITGIWYGYPYLKTHRLRLIIELQQQKDICSATLKIPDLSDRIYPATKADFINTPFNLEFPDAGISCQINRQTDKQLHGTLTQDGYTFPLILSRQPVVFHRPQTPQPPFPYRSEEVTFRNEAAGIILAGTLTLPLTPTTKKAVLFISGSGPQDRDNTFHEHKTFLVIADYLARNGIASLRVDDRGTGASTGNFNASGLPDFETDAYTALQYLKQRPEIRPDSIGIIGHSEGAFIAFNLAARKEVAFIITLAGGGVNGSELLLLQRAALLRASGAKEEFINTYNQYMQQAQEIVLQTADAQTCERKLTELFVGTPLAGQASETTRQLYNPGKIELLKYDPEWDFPEITCPVLALNGDKDCQVPVENLTYIHKGITTNGNLQVTTIAYPGLNHMFQTADKGLPVEYSDIEETICPKVIKDIIKWIKAQ